MESVANMIPERKEGEQILAWARRIKAEGFNPEKDMDPRFYEIARHQQRLEKADLEEELAALHKCIPCKGRGVIESTRGSGEWHKCAMCSGSGEETFQEEDLAPAEVEFKTILEGMDVHPLKLKAEFIHRVFFYCHHITKKTEPDEMMKVFFRHVHISKRAAGYFVVCDLPPAWRSEEIAEEGKQKKKSKTQADPAENPFI